MKTVYILFCALLIGLASYGQTITPKGPVTLCSPGTVELDATAGGTNYNWYNNGVVITGAIANTYVASVSGSYTVAYTVGGNRDSTKVPVIVTVNDLPQADFTANQVNQCSSTPVYFTNKYPVAGSKYQWNFGDPNSGGSNTSSLASPAHSFIGDNNGGTENFSVMLTVTNSNNCVNTVSKPVARFMPKTQLNGTGAKLFNNENYFSKCLQSETSAHLFYTYQSSGAANPFYEIKWGDNTSDFQSPTFSSVTHNYKVGLYTLQFIVTEQGCTDTANYKVFVGSTPGGNLDPPPNLLGCTDTTFKIPFTPATQNNSQGTIYTISVDDGTPVETYVQPPPPFYQHTFHKPSCNVGVNNFFTLSSHISNACGDISNSSNIIGISQRPQADFAFSPADTACVNSTVQISNINPNATSVDASHNCTIAKNIWSITPNSGWTETSGDFGNDFNFDDPSLWTSGTDVIGVKFTSSGLYSVKLKVGGNSSCGGKDTTKIICVNPEPNASFTIGATTACVPMQRKVTTTTNSLSCGEYTYQWTVSYTPTAGCLPNNGNVTYLNGTSNTSREPFFSFNSPGVYIVTLVVTSPGGACSSAPYQQTLTVRGKPVITSLGLPAVICQSQTVNPSAAAACYINGNTTYNWSFPGASPNVGSGKTPGIISFSTPGTYTVVLKANNNDNICTDTVVTQQITVNPVPDLSARGDTSYCVGAASGAYNFTSKLAGTTITWANSNTAIGLGASGTGSISSFTTKNSGTAPISATITVTATNTNCSTQASFTITVNPVPGLPVVTNPVNLCTGTAAQPLTAMADAGNTLVWYAAASGGIGSPTAFTPTTNSTGTQLYYVSQSNHVNALACESGRAVIQVIVDTTPKITFGSVQGPGNCSSQTGSITLNGLVANKTYKVCYSFNGNPQTCVSNIPSDAAGNLVLGNLGSGTYTNISVTLGQCPSNTIAGPIQISDPIKPVAPSIVFNASPVCSNKAVQLSPSPITQGSTYTWYGPGITSALKNQTTPSFTATTNLAGNYSVTVTDANGCTSDKSVQAPLQVDSTPVTPKITGSSPICTGTPFTLTGSKYTYPVTYSWTPVPNTSIIKDSTLMVPSATTSNSGTYNLVVTNVVSSPKANSCPSGPATMPIIVNPTPNISKADSADPKNCGASDGQITLYGLAVSTSYTVFYTDASGTVHSTTIKSDNLGNVVIPGLSAIASPYRNIYVQDAVTLCTSNAINRGIKLTDPNPPATPTASSNKPVCTGKTVQLQASPTLPGVTYTWSGPGITPAIANAQNPSFAAIKALDGTSYTVTVTQNGCTSSPSLPETIQVDSTPVTPKITGTSPICTGTPFTLTGSKYTYPVTYTWTPVPNPSIIKDSTLTVTSATTGNSGTYTLVVTNVVSSPKANSCPSGPATMPMIVNPTPNISKADSADPKNCGASDGQITLYGLAVSTSYTVFYTDASGTVHSKTIKSDNLGNVVITGLSAIASPYTNIYVQDAITLCTSNAINRGIKLTDPNPPATPTASSNKPVCTGKTVQLQASPTLPGVTYTWSGPGITPAIANMQNPTFAAIKALDGTSYTVTVTQNGCTSSPSLPETIQIDSTPVTPKINATSPVCTGTSFTLTGSKYNYPVTYTWSPVPSPSIIKDSTLTVTSATTGNTGTYTLVVTNVVSSPTANSCASKPETRQITVNPTPNISKADSTNPSQCGAADGQITLYGLTGSTNYVVYYTDGSGVVRSKTIKSDNLGNVVISGLSASASLYSNIYVQDAVTLCTSNAINRGIKLSDPNPPAAPTATSNKPLCTGKTVQLQASPTLPGVTYTWSGPGITPAIANMQNPTFAAIKSLDGTSYTVTITQNGCTSSPSLPETIQIDSTPELPNIKSTGPVCTGTSFTLTGSKYNYPVTYTWSPVPSPSIIKDPTLTVTSATTGNSGTYTLVVTNVVSSPTANSCPSKPATIPITVNPTPNIANALPTNPKSCGAADGFITLQGLAPTTNYIVDYVDGVGKSHTATIKADVTGDVVIPGLTASGGPYTKIYVQDASSLCTSNSVGPITLTDPDPPAAPIATNSGPVCDGSVLNLYASPTVPGGVYAWSGPCITAANANLQNPSFTATVACTGQYKVTVTTNNCTSLPGSTDVVVNANAAVPTANGNTPVCSGNLINLTANSTPVGTGPITYLWAGPSINATNNALQNPSFKALMASAGTYCVTAFNAGCPSKATGCVTVAVDSTPAITADYANPTSCGTNTGRVTLYGVNLSEDYTLAYDYIDKNNVSHHVNQPHTYAVYPGDVVISNLPAGIYKNIFVTTPQGCPSNTIGPDTLVNLAAPVPTAKSNGPLCVGSSLNLTSFVAPLLGTVTYTWSGPGAVRLLPSNDVQNPTIPITTMADSGLYTVTATINGCSLSASVNVVINAKSVGGRTFNDTTVCYGTNTGTIQLAGNNGRVLNWQYSTNQGGSWVNVNNTTSSLVFNNLTTTTQYRAVVQNGVCDTALSTVTVITVINAVPPANAGPNQMLCNQQSVNLAATKSVIGTGLWTQTAGPAAAITPADAPNASVTPLVPAVYNFLWTVTGPPGCGSSSAQVQITNRPAITKAVAGPEQDICNFTHTSTVTLAANQDATRPFENGLWTIVSQPRDGSGTFGNATSPASTFTFSQPGIYQLAWTISNDVGAACGSSTDTLLIQVANPPIAAFSASPAGLCVGQPVTVTNTSANTKVYNWHWGDGLAATFVNGTHSYAAAGTYTITLVAENVLPAATCKDSAKQTVTVADIIPAVINITPGNPCLPYLLQADAVGAAGASLIEWRIFDKSVPPGVFYATGASASHEYDFAGNDSIRLIVHNQGICTDSASYHFTVYGVPVTTFAPQNFSTCNHDTTVVFSASTIYNGNDPITYKWFVNNQLSGITNPFSYGLNTPLNSTVPVEYNIKLLAQNAGNCGDSSTPALIKVLPLPRAGIRVAPSIIQQEPDYTFTFTDTTTADQFKIDKWYLGDHSNQTRNGTEVTYQYSDSGTYFVTLLATDFTSGCTNTDTVTVRILYVPGYLQVPDAFCPGCAKQELRTFLPLGKGLSYYRLRIYTIWGKLIFETTRLNADGSPSEPWKGDDHGQPVQQDAYRWEIEARFVNGTEWKGMLYPNNSQRVKSGFITIIK